MSGVLERLELLPAGGEGLGAGAGGVELAGELGDGAVALGVSGGASASMDSIWATMPSSSRRWAKLRPVFCGFFSVLRLRSPLPREPVPEARLSSAAWALAWALSSR